MRSLTITQLILILVKSFSYTPDTTFDLMLERNTHHDVFARSIFYSPLTDWSSGFSQEFLIQSTQ